MRLMSDTCRFRCKFAQSGRNVIVKGYRSVRAHSLDATGAAKAWEAGKFKDVVYARTTSTLSANCSAPSSAKNVLELDIFQSQITKV